MGDQQTYKTVVIQFLIYSGIAFFILLVCVYGFIGAQLWAPVAAYVLSFLFVASNFFIVRKVKKGSGNGFYRQFFVTLSLRFILVIIALVVILKATEFHKINFTVSFIISYIFHSAIEVHSINKIIEIYN
ncbi:hypothetical protein LX73_0305 [Fodinibius salinus]|uniref:ATP synthase I chain n=1 Tax=Fodinibius salinus TaxID=860790 RepID=A0A5D3YR35_9BACT|nr:hypothetical protein [Fodinibius salinus]TYP95011.1 hypothetical protein LX73_0305 [Fodinibius salinus]